MKKINFDRKQKRAIRHTRITNKFKSFANDKPRFVVTKTNAHIFCQIIDDAKNHTLASSSTVQLKIKNANVASAKTVGEDIAKKALALQIKNVVFDRAGNKYHGRVKAVAEAARAMGLVF